MDAGEGRIRGDDDEPLILPAGFATDFAVGLIALAVGIGLALAPVMVLLSRWLAASSPR